jgi:hypothetical protein
MTTPIYKGNGQPSPNGEGWLGSLLGGAPPYRGVGQPAQQASSILGGSQPAYQPASTADSSGAMASTNPDANACGPIAIMIPRQVIEPQQ